MDNLSFIKGVGMPAEVALKTRSHQLGEKPSDHFHGLHGSLSIFSEEGGLSEEIMALLGDILTDLTPDDQAQLDDWARQMISGEPADQDAVVDMLVDVMGQLTLKLKDKAVDAPGLAEIEKLVVLEMTQDVEHRGRETLLVRLSESAFNDHSESDMNTANDKQASLGALIKDYVEGYRKIGSHYGSPREYSFQDIVATVSSSWHQSMPPEITLTPLSMIGTGIAEHIGDHYRDTLLSSHGRMDSPEKMAAKHDMVLDRQMAQAIITKAIESLNVENHKIKENEFTLKVHPRSLGEINVSVTTSRDLVNISIDASPEVADKIKSDIIYFSNKYDNMEWRLNDDAVGSHAAKKSDGIVNEKLSIPLLESSFNQYRIINIII